MTQYIVFRQSHCRWPLQHLNLKISELGLCTHKYSYHRSDFNERQNFLLEQSEQITAVPLTILLPTQKPLFIGHV